MDEREEQRLRKERDLYRQCLELTRPEDPGPLLEQTLSLLRELVQAERGYVELCDLSSTAERKWSADAGVDDSERELIRRRISQGIIAEAIESERTVHTPSAALDDRFAKRESVRAGRIEAVLCVPLRAQNVVGAVYLQNRIGGGPFGEDDVRAAETITRFVGTIAARLLEVLKRRDQADATGSARARLEGMDQVVGRSHALAQMLDRLGVLAGMDVTTLLTGPTGTGKSTFARLLHDNSKRAGKPFVEVNCATLTESLAESELFGAERGAHSAVANTSMQGKVAAAEGGTLFLDEIGELHPGVQAKLLQLLQNKQYFRLGGTVPQHADVRIISATHRDLKTAPTFREDLYYRLRGVELRVPSLAERREDVPLLAQYLFRRVCIEHELHDMSLAQSALEAIEFADWPGNIRELLNACQDAAVEAKVEGAGIVEVRHVFREAHNAGGEVPRTFSARRADFEKKLLASELVHREWNVAQTARELDMARSHLNALIRRYNLRRD